MQSNNLKIWLTHALLSLLFVGCESAGVGDAADDTDQEEETLFCLVVSDAGYTSSPTSRAYEQYYHTEFESGDQIGLFILQDGAVIVANEPYTCNALGEWNGEVGYMGGAFLDSDGSPKDGVEYFAYFPYSDALDSSTVVESGAVGATANEFFANVVAAWSSVEDQSDRGYESSDLMISKGYFNDIYLNTHSLYFGFVHQMSMLHLEFPYSSTEPASNISLSIDGVVVGSEKLHQLTKGNYAGAENHFRYIFEPSSVARSLVVEYDFGGVADITTSANVTFSSSSYVYYIIDGTALPADAPEVVTTEDDVVCVGAFWRADQKGERIISMQPDMDNYGFWRAIVYEMSTPWLTRDNIQLSADMSGFDPEADAENFVVDEGVQIVRGYSDFTMPIEFRVGLGAEYTPTEDAPARYATILLTYCNNTKYFLLYLRQGEEPDYLFREGDVLSDGSSRTLARKWSPYNLTKGASDVWEDAGYAILADKADFVEYPSQVGSLVPWGSTVATNVARAKWVWKPTGAVSSWLAFSATVSYWATISDSFENSPAGYRRPVDGATDVATTVTWDVSETMQSLFLAADDTSNRQYGYYADGYADRAGGEATDETMAAAGVLFYNPNNFASLFLPMTSTLLSSSGVATSTLSQGYWSSSMLNTSYPWHFSLSATAAPVFSSGLVIGSAMPIRAVVDDTTN